MSLIAGGDGILGKAESAVEANKVATAKEEAELLIAEKKTEWYEKKYVKGESVGTFKDYLKTELGSGETTNSGNKVKVDANGNITIEDASGSTISTGTLGDNGKLAWADTTTGGTTPTISEKLKVGDTVSYTPSGTYAEWTTAHSGYSTSYSLASGSLYTDSSTQTDMTITSWKVFKIDEATGEVQLVPSSPTSNSLYLQGANGYNNAVKLLNDACRALYSNTAKGIIARSINIDDIESVLNYDPTMYVNSNVSVKYGQQYSSAYTIYKAYPNIYASEKNNVIDGKENEGTLGLSDSASDWVSGTTTEGTSIQPYQTYYYLSNSDFSSKLNDGYSEMLLPSGSSTQYWVASRCVNLCPSYYCNFRVREVRKGVLDGYWIFDSGIKDYPYSQPLFPVVSLSSEVIEGDATSGWVVK